MFALEGSSRRVIIVYDIVPRASLRCSGVSRDVCQKLRAFDRVYPFRCYIETCAKPGAHIS